MPVPLRPQGVIYGATNRLQTRLDAFRLRRIPHTALQLRPSLLSDYSYRQQLRSLSDESGSPEADHSNVWTAYPPVRRLNLKSRKFPPLKTPDAEAQSSTPRALLEDINKLPNNNEGGGAGIKPQDHAAQTNAIGNVGVKEEEEKGDIPRHFNPSQAVVDALKTAGYAHAVPRLQKNKVKLRPGNARGKQQGAKDVHESLAVGPDDYQPGKYSLSTNLYLIVARCIRGLPFRDTENTFSERWKEEGSAEFSSAINKYLGKHGYSRYDVLDWCSVLTHKDSEQAALQLLRLCNRKRSIEYKACPAFVLLLLLRRERLSAQSLELLLRHSVDRVFRQHNTRYENIVEEVNSDTDAKAPPRKSGNNRSCSAQYQNIQSDTFVLLAIRLIRHARQVWPTGLPGITRLITNYFVASSHTDVASQSYQSFTFNRILQLLSLPSDQTPFLAIPYHQRAQFQLIRHMSTYDPPLSLSREGYRAIARVQLAHRKSLPEREWAMMKSNTWPPYKQDRTGLDADIGVEHGISRARETLSKINESGFEADSWEQAGMILSGWDTDESPTIQTRAIMNLKKGLIRAHKVPGKSEFAEADDVWPSRIKATRTLDEAWATFLSYKQSAAPISENAYYEMANKIVFDGLRTSNNSTIERTSHHPWEESTHEKIVLPGDGPEVSAPPRDPRERIYVHTPPPTLMSFIESAISDGIRLRGRFLAFLVQHARHLDQCAKYFQNSTLAQNTVRQLLGTQEPSHSDLSKVPDTVFSAYISFLARSGHPLPPRFRPSDVTIKITKFEGGQLHQLLHAFRLVYVLRPNHRLPWHTLVSALTEEITQLKKDKFRSDPVPLDIHLWDVTLEVVSAMRAVDVNVDASMFRLLCVAFAKAARASRGWMMSNSQHEAQEKSDEKLKHGLEQLKGIFRKMVSAGTDDHITPGLHKEVEKAFQDGQQSIDTSNILPRILEVPQPAQLHAFIRALGAVEDFEGLRDLTKWMVRFAPEINVMKREARNGHSQLRKCLAALRVYLEGDLIRELVADKDEITKRNFNPGQAPEELVQEVFELVEEIDEWRGWPSDEDVERYCLPQDLPVRVARKV